MPDAVDQFVRTPRETRIRETLPNASIADYSDQRHEVAESAAQGLGTPDANPDRLLSIVTQEARDVNLGMLSEVIEKIWNRDDLSEKTRETFDQIVLSYAEGQDPSATMLTTAEIDNPTFDKSNLLPEIILLTILKDPELSPILMEEIDGIVKKRSDALLNEIDELAKEGKTKVVGLGITGGGPLTSLALSAIGPLYDNLVITEADRLGEPWRSRLLIFINSAVQGDGSENAPLPILEGGTTPIVARYLQQAIRLGYLLDDKDLTVLCKEGEIEEGRANRFIAGEKLGNAVALNVFAYADNALVGQKVIPEATGYLANGNKLITFEDVSTGKRRSVEVQVPLFLTGPGEEYLPLEDDRSKRDYAASNLEVEYYIENVKDQIAKGIPVVLPRLPRILTLTSTEKLLKLWSVDLKRNPRLYPLTPLFKKSNVIGLAGGGDTVKCENEFLRLASPDSAYPAEFKRKAKKSLPKRVGYRFPRPKNVRVRYREQAKVSERIDRRISSFANEGKKVTVTDVKGISRSFDYLFVGLGFQRNSLEEALYNGAGIRCAKVGDLEGEVVALGNPFLDTYIAGSATGFKKQDLPERIRNIIDINGIPENTISLWVNAILTERLCYRIARTTRLNREKIDRLYSSGVTMPLVNRMVGGLIFTTMRERVLDKRATQSAVLEAV